MQVIEYLWAEFVRVPGKVDFCAVVPITIFHFIPVYIKLANVLVVLDVILTCVSCVGSDGLYVVVYKAFYSGVIYPNWGWWLRVSKFSEGVADDYTGLYALKHGADLCLYYRY